jgi:hypothetical protein
MVEEIAQVEGHEGNDMSTGRVRKAMQELKGMPTGASSCEACKDAAYCVTFSLDNGLSIVEMSANESNTTNSTSQPGVWITVSRAARAVSMAYNEIKFLPSDSNPTAEGALTFQFSDGKSICLNPDGTASDCVVQSSSVRTGLRKDVLDTKTSRKSHQ